MNDYVVFTDATADLPQDIVEKYNINVIPMNVTLGEKVFEHYPDFRNMSAKDFYATLSSGVNATTSQISPAKYEEIFTPYLKEGKDILYLVFSSGLSSTYQSSIIARSDLEDLYPNQKITIIDTLGACGGEGLMVLYAARNKQDGMTLEENAEWITNNIQHFAHWFTVNDLYHLKRGGRVTGTSAFVGTALSIKPVLHTDEEGHLINMAKVHGRKASLNALVDKLKETIINPVTQTIIINNAQCKEDAEYVANRIKEVCPVNEIIISDMGPVIGAHTGQGCVALFFFADHR